MKLKHIFSCVYKFLLIIHCAYGLYLNLNKSLSYFTFVSLFTNISNAIVLISYIWILHKFIFYGYPKEKRYFVVKGGITLMIFLTFSVYHILLVPSLKKRGIFDYYDTLHRIVHYDIPFATLLDYILFDKKGKFRFYYIFYWLLMPILYLAFVFIRAELGFKFYYKHGTYDYPYYFLNYKKYGVLSVCKRVGIISVSYTSLGLIFVLIDSKLASLKQKSKKKKDN